jgi:regulator of nucleoside diphosphate kinase
MRWMEDHRVTRYLSDPGNVSSTIEQALDRTQMPILTPLFNQGGRFFMVYDRTDTPVGFVRLVKAAADCEIVVVIGDHRTWERRIGASAIREGLKIAFLDMRTRNVVAKIHPDNLRSLRAFRRCGFLPKAKTSALVTLSMSAGDYLQLLRAGTLAGLAQIYITETDKERLENLIASEQGPGFVELEHEIERAIVVDPEKLAGNVVTMNSRVVVHLENEKREVVLVYPPDANETEGRLSILSEVGAALLGYWEGNAIDWTISDRTCRIRIEQVIYQPERSGDFHL